MKNRYFAFLVLFIFILTFVPQPVYADGIIIPDPIICAPELCPLDIQPLQQLIIRYHHVTVTIENQVAVTHVDQVFYNPSDFQIEGIYVFPIPKDSVVSNFTLWIDGKPVEGQVLDATQARQRYEEIVNSLRDPALLEYVGQGAMQARIFPIPPKGERRIELEYTQVLTADNGLVGYIYPLNTEKFSAAPLENVTIHVDIHSSNEPIRAVYSPTHNIETNHPDNQHATADFEASNITPDTDFSLFYSIGQSQALHLLTYRDPNDLSDPDGFFMLLLAPQPDVSIELNAKNVILVLDHSGSMEGEKFQQAQAAVKYMLEHLNPEDRFNIVNFSTNVETYASNLRPAQEANLALDWISNQSAVGRTDINRALLEATAMSEGENPTYIIFMTDGLPTEGVIDSQLIIDNFSQNSRKNIRLFAFGVGYDVDTFLLDSLAQENQGSSIYVKPGERLDEVLSSFFAKINTPVLTNLSLDFGNISTHDVLPLPLPDLFAGSQIIVTGRYHKAGNSSITLTGEVNGQTQTFIFPEQVFPESSTDKGNSALPRLWATRKVGYLLNQIRLSGPDQETIDQIVKLSIRYGIVTPYTSYLVTEDMPLGASEQDRIANDQYSFMATAPAAPVSGAPAVEKAADQGQMAGADSLIPSSEETTRTVRIIGARTFVKSKDVWMDTTFDPDTMQTLKVPFLSNDYFALSAARPELAAAFALGSRVIALSEGLAYEVVGSTEPGTPIEIPVTITPEPGTVNIPGSTTPIPTTQKSNPLCASGLLAFLPIGLLLYKKHSKQGRP
jgi:Ca-activated chloride channel family protein